MLKSRDSIKNCRRIVIKIGSNLIASPGKGLNVNLISSLAGEISTFIDNNIEVVVVSSGAIACGIESFDGDLPAGFGKRNIPERQAMAAFGQSRLIHTYEKIFATSSKKVAQILLTHDDMANRKRFLNAKNTISVLLEFGILPIINENDTVSVDEIKLGDNDNLAGQIVNLINADLLILLSDVDGLYSSDPKNNPEAEKYDLVERITSELESVAGKVSGGFGTGGMYSKVRTVKRVTALGAGVVIADGTLKNVLSDIINGKKRGTLFISNRERIKSRKHWIGYSLKEKGRIVLDRGAENALLKNGSSLLPSGIVSIEGNFDIGDVALCIDRNGLELARGIVNYSSKELDSIKGKKTSSIEDILGYKYCDEIIHRDNMLVFDNQ